MLLKKQVLTLFVNLLDWRMHKLKYGYFCNTSSDSNFKSFASIMSADCCILFESIMQTLRFCVTKVSVNDINVLLVTS